MSDSRKTVLTWKTTLKLVKNLRDSLPEGCFVYGIPRGGAIVAGLLHPHCHVVDNAQDANYLIDDILDSHQTRLKWQSMYHNIQFFGLIDKKNDPQWGNKWIEFPWETNEPTPSGEDIVTRMIEYLGENPNREGLKDTPKRVVKSWSEFYGGYHLFAEDILSAKFDQGTYSEFVILKDIEFQSHCEHHLCEFSGRAHFGYLPDERVVGISKIARLVDMYARRLQIQERMSDQIVQSFQEIVQPKGCGVVIEATHSCMTCRGIKSPNVKMVTSALRGSFREPAMKAEFFHLIR
ncbi:GTP cyclohydrolase IA [Gammaproteobacteria bacterium]